MASRAVRSARASQFRNSLELDIDRDGTIFVKTKPIFEKELRNLLKEIERAARFYVGRKHHKTGKLQRSIHARREIKKYAGGKRIGGIVTAGGRNAPYAHYVHDGTRPHIIEAKPGKFLWFKGNKVNRKRTVVGKRLVAKGMPIDIGGKIVMGQDAYDDVIGPGLKTLDQERLFRVRKVNHPGYRGDPYLVNASIVVVRRHGGRVNPGITNTTLDPSSFG